MLDKEIEPNDNWIDPDNTVDDKHQRHIDAIAHLDKDILNAVRHLPTILAVETGDILMRTKMVNEHIVKSIFCPEGDQNA